MKLPTVVSHRGAAASAPENTLAGIRRAAALGARWVEFDAMLTADARCVLFHDDLLDRTTDAKGPIAEVPYETVRRLDAGSWFAPEFAGEPVPSLEAALAEVVALGLRVDLEIKPSAGREVETATAVMAEVRALWPKRSPPPLITSYEPECLEVARASAPGWPRGLICFRLPGDWRARLEALGCRILVCMHGALTRRKVAAITETGIALMTFTVNRPRRAAKLWRWGVSSIITDAPELILPLAPDGARAPAPDAR